MQIQLNGEARTLTQERSVADLVRSLGLEGRRLAVEHNGEILRRDAFPQTPLADGDRVEIVHAIGGG